MAYSAALDVAYNHYLTAYVPKTTQYDTHKKSELRSIYNSIVKLNKDAPLYILDTSSESRQFAVGLKEGARNLRNTIASLGGLDKEDMFLFQPGGYCHCRLRGRQQRERQCAFL